MKKKIGYGIIIVLVAAFAAYRYIYQEHRNISNEKATFTISLAELEKEFATNDSLAFLKYQDKTIELTGKVSTTDFKNKAIILESKLFATCTDSLPKDIVSGQQLSIKGRFLGYDELLDEYKMDQSIIIR